MAVLMKTSVHVCLCIWVLMCVHMCFCVYVCACALTHMHACANIFLCALSIYVSVYEFTCASEFVGMLVGDRATCLSE